MSSPSSIDPYLALAMQQALPPDNGVRVGSVFANDGGSLRVTVNGGVVQAGYLTSYVPRIGDTVAMMRQDAGWLVLGSLYGDAAPTQTNDFADTWHQADLQNGWVHRAGGFPAIQYRFAWSPDFIMIMGQMTPGTIADNTLIFTLPPAYRPEAESVFSARKATNAYCLFAIQNDGTVRIYDSAGSAVVQIPNAVIPLRGLILT